METPYLAQFAAPFAAILIAFVTLVYNIFDRRRFYRIEREKISSEIRNTVVEKTNYLSRKYECYNGILISLSKINREITDADSRLPESGTELRELSGALKRSIEIELDQIVTLLQDEQLAISEELHREITRGFLVEALLTAKSFEMDLSRSSLSSSLSKIRSLVEMTKDRVRASFSTEIDEMFQYDTMKNIGT